LKSVDATAVSGVGGHDFDVDFGLNVRAVEDGRPYIFIIIMGGSCMNRFLQFKTLAAVLITAAWMGCGGSTSISQPPTQQQQPVYQPQPVSQPPAQQQQTTTQTVSSSPPAPAPVATTPPAVKTAAADELDVAIRDASDCLNDNIPKGSKIVILNIESNFANLSEYIIDELIANAINDKNFSVVDRRQLEAIQAEQKFQMSGAVDDKDALAIGRFFGAQTIISGAMREMGGRYRMTVRALAVQTAVVQSQCNQNIAIAASAALTDLVKSGVSSPASATYSGASASGTTTPTAAIAPAPTAAATPTTQAIAPAPDKTAPAEPPIQGIVVPGHSLEDKLTWLTKSADSHNTYILEVNEDEKIAPHTFEFKGGLNITIILRGDNKNRTIRLKSNGTMFTVKSNVTFVLDNNVTLQGHSNNKARLIYVQGGTFRMKIGSTVIGNSDGGIYVGSQATFEMTGGTISGNTTDKGGGVHNYGTFTMSGGTISGNIANRGGGVCNAGKFNMKNGNITGNTAHEYGGGVWAEGGSGSSFVKVGGIITGYSSDQTSGNVVKDTDDYILARKGHAVLGEVPYKNPVRKETTAGPNVNLSHGSFKSTGAWDN